MIIKSVPPSPESIVVLNALRSAVAKELDRKKRLGHYYVSWENDRIVLIGDDAPQTPNETV
jgi:hypothetical protein